MHAIINYHRTRPAAPTRARRVADRRPAPLAVVTFLIFSILVITLLAAGPWCDAGAANGREPSPASGVSETPTPAPTPLCPFTRVDSGFGVGDDATAAQQGPAVAADDEGDFVVVWETYGQGSDGHDVYAQLFDAAGAPRGAAFRVNTVGAGTQYDPAVVMDADGRFVVVWSHLTESHDDGVYARRFDATGSALGAEFRVDAGADTVPRSTAAAMDDAGNFVVVWSSWSSDGSLYNVYARRFDAAGAPRGPESRITPADRHQSAPDVAMGATGDYVVAWAGGEPDDSTATYLQLFDAAGAPRGPAFRPNTSASTAPDGARVAMGEGGHFVAVWSGHHGSTRRQLFARRFDAAGAPQGPEFLVSAATHDDQVGASVATGRAGEFLIAWWSKWWSTAPPFNANHEIYARRYDGAGVPQGAGFRVNSETSYVYEGPRSLLERDGDFMVAWSQLTAQGSRVRAQRFAVSCPTPTPTPTPGPTLRVQFGAPTYRITEGCVAASLDVVLDGPPPAHVVTADYTTTGGTASQKSDYTYAAGAVAYAEAAPAAGWPDGRLAFAPGETKLTIEVLVSEDGYAEGPETVLVTLANPVGAALGEPATATLTIDDNETADSETNPIDDPATFVCQHYHDFLQRQPDPFGQAFWADEIMRCGADPACVAERRHHVSAAFFLSIEFQQTGYFVGRLYEGCLGRYPSYEEFMRDVRSLGQGVEVGVGDWEQRLEQNKRAYARVFVRRGDFLVRYPEAMTAEQYVGGMFQYASVEPTAAERQAALDAYGAGGAEGRAASMRAAMESATVFRHYYNRGFVLAEYFGYLRRDPHDPPDADFAGYDFWLGKMNAFSLPGEDVTLEPDAFARVRRGEMVRAFIESLEYRGRFGRP